MAKKMTSWNKEVKKYVDKGQSFPEALKSAKKTYVKPKPKK